MKDMKTTTARTMSDSNPFASAEPGLRAIAQRIDNALECFTETLMNLGGIERAAAERAMAYCRKHKLVKLDAVGGRMTVKHGAYLDREAIRRAATL